MQQKVMLILAFLSSPDLYLVDEPFLGLDPLGVKEFLELMNEERERGAGILMSTHVLDAAEKMCTSFILIHNGEMLAKGTLEHIRHICNAPQASLFECFHSLTTTEGQ
jgi:ABC-2 type transport system ATP-binding protein